MIPCNVWLLDSAELALSYSLQGGRVILITEDEDPRLQYIPNKLSASILLPPYDAISAELDGNLDLAQYKYYEYLSSSEPAEFISILLTAAIQNIKIGLYFGNELKELKFPMMLMNYFYFYKGLSIGYKDLQPGFVDNYVPPMLGDLLGRDLIGPEQFLMFMPNDMDIPDFILPALVQIFRPPFVEDGDYNKYFKTLISEIKSAGKYLYCPLVAPEVR